MKIAIASDHGGFELKEDIKQHLFSKGIEVYDFGTHDTNSCDYPIFAKHVANSIIYKDYEKGILVCGTGVGMAITANRFKGIRAVNCSDTYTAKLSRMHNDSNILALGARVIAKGLAFDIVDIWLNTEFESGRHKKRIDMIDED